MGLIKSAIRRLERMIASSAAKRLREISDRPTLADADYYRRFYLHTDVKLATCVGVRGVLCEQLRLCNSLPHDNVAILFPDTDIGEVCFEIGEEFRLAFPEAVIRDLGGTVDSLIRTTQALQDSLPREVTPGHDRTKR